MPDLDSIRLYLFEGVPVYTDVRRESDLLGTYAYVNLRIARAEWRERHGGRDPRYLAYLDGYAFASCAMGTCPGCQNERPRVADFLICFCRQYASASG